MAPYPEAHESTSLHPTNTRSILILPSHLCIDVLEVSSIQNYILIFCMHSSSLPCVLNACLPPRKNYLQMTKMLIMKCSPASCYFPSLKYKHFLEPPILRFFQSVLFSQNARPSLTPIQISDFVYFNVYVFR
jgi:hypothetical protein